MSASRQSDRLSNSAVVHPVASGDTALVNGVASRDRTSSLGKEEVVKMNLMAIRKIDSQVETICSTVPKVVLYQYDGANNTWERTSVEGTLFVYSRMSSPSHGFMILNRLSSDNMHDLLSPDLQFRVESPFVLFKRNAGKIHGLCFQEEQQSQEIGELLTKLSSGVSNGYSSGAHGMTASMRSSSAPSIDKQGHTHSARSTSPHKVDVMEVLETAGRSYLGQTFSDDANSQDSLTSEPITFTAAPVHQQQREVARTQRTSSDRMCLESSTSPKPRSKGGRNPHQTRSTSPKNIPGTNPAAQLPQSFSLSPKQTRQRASSSKQTGSQRPRQRGQLQHASSFSSKTHTIKDSEKPLKEHNGSLPSSRSTSPFSTTPQKKHSGVSELSPDSGNPDPNQVVRKLFTPDTASGDREHPPNTSSYTPRTLQTLFSQASTTTGGSVGIPQTTSASIECSGSLPLNALSLTEIESQMKAEVPSPERTATFTHFSSTAKTQPATTTGSINHTSSDEKTQVLLQPSAFVTAPPNTAVNTQHMTTAATMDSTYSPSKGVHQYQNMSTSSVQIYSAPPVSHSNLQPSTSESVSVLVEPPSPVVIRSQSSGTFMSPPAHIPPSFPAIPPLMHSPGMKAAPIGASKNAKDSSSNGKRKYVVEGTSQPMHILHARSEQAVPVEKLQRSSTSPELLMLAGGTSSATGLQIAPHTAVVSISGLTPLPDIDVSRRGTVPSTLMSPMQFANKQNKDAASPDVVGGLTREQLQQALVYLIHHDEGFLNKVHQAYQLSLAEKKL